MPKRRPSDIEEENDDLNPGEGVETTVQDRLEQDSSLEIEDLLRTNELAGGSVRIERRRRGDAESSIIHTKLPVRDFDLELIKTTYGGGFYRFIFRSAGGAILKRCEMNFADEIKPESEKQQANGNGGVDKLAAILQSKGGDNNALLLAILEMQRSDREAQRQQQAEQLAAQRAHSQEMMTLISGAMKQPPMPNLIDQLAKLGAILTPVLDFFKSTRSGTKEALEMIQIAKGIGSEGGGGADDGVLNKLLSTVGPMMMAKMAPQPTEAPVATTGQPQPAVPTPAVAATAQPALPNPPTDATDPAMIRHLLIQQLRDGYDEMAWAAAKEVEPTAFYQMFGAKLEDQPQIVIDALIELLQQPNWTELCFGKPTVPNQQWFNELRELIVKDFGPDDPKTETEAPTPAKAEAKGKK